MENSFSTKEAAGDDVPQAVAEKSVENDVFGNVEPDVKKESALEPSSLHSEPPPVVQKDVEVKPKRDVDKTMQELEGDLYSNVRSNDVDGGNSKMEEGEVLSQKETLEEGQIDERNENEVKPMPEPVHVEPVLEQNPEDAKVRKLFVGGLHYDADETVLREFYSTYGDVEEVFVARNPATHLSKGYAFVTFTSRAAVDAVIKSRPHEIIGKSVAEKRATPKESGMAIDTNALYIAGISELVNEGVIREYFCKYGEIESVKIHVDHATQKPKGYGFINFVENDSVDQCVLDRLYHVVNGVEIKASKAIPRDAQKNRDRTNRFVRSRGFNRNPQQQMGYSNYGNTSNRTATGWSYQQQQQQTGGWMVPPKHFGTVGQPTAFTGSSYANALMSQNLAYRASAGADPSSVHDAPSPFMKAYFEAMTTNTNYPPFFPPPPKPSGGHGF